jgi:hypothetical protein
MKSTVINRQGLGGESFFGPDVGLESQGFAGCDNGTLQSRF